MKIDVMNAPRASKEATTSPVAPGPRNGRPSPLEPGTTRVAAIDIGSNSIRQIVADVESQGKIRVVDEMKAAPRLGAYMTSDGQLGEESMSRAVDAIVRMTTLARQLGATRIEAVATSAVRDAGNATTFISSVRRASGVRLRILSGEEEARLSYRSALAHFDLASGRAVVADIGGGSLELAHSASGVLDCLESFPFGALRLTEQYLTSECRHKDVRKLRKAVRSELRRHVPARAWRGAQFIGSGGTFTNLASILLAREAMLTAQSVHGTRVSRADLEHVLDGLQDTTLAERMAVPGLSQNRADIIVAGLAVIAEVMARLDTKELVVSTYGIREGLLLETARIQPAAASPGEARQRSVRELAARCAYEAPHSLHVRDLSLQLYDALAPLLGCEAGDRQALADAALLHDIGYHISYDRHHKHSYYLILHAELLGMSPSEQVVVANVARYHRGAIPKKKHRNLDSLSKPMRDQIKRLAALLRVADGFDRGHAGAVKRLQVRKLVRAIRIRPIPRAGQSLRLEMWGAGRKAELLSSLAGSPVEIISPAGAIVTHIPEVRQSE